MLAASGMALVGAAAFAAGAVNAIAGGGSLITFPALVAVGLSPVVASLTNTVALCPGYLGATLAQRRDLAGQRARMWRVLPAGVLGGTAGALLLLSTDEHAFDYVVPFLILLAVALLAAQPRLQRRLFAHDRAERPAWAFAPVGIAAMYGGYFGAGLGVLLLASLAVVLADSLTRVNALKQAVSLVVNASAAAVFLGSGRVDWAVAGVMLVTSLLGGVAGGAVATRIPARALRWLIVTLGTAVAIVYITGW